MKAYRLFFYKNNSLSTKVLISENKNKKKLLCQEYTPFNFACLLYIGESSFTFLSHVSSKFAWKNKKKLRTIYPKNSENFKSSNPRVRF